MSFKKCISLFLVIFLLLSSNGFALNVHYCNDAIASITFEKQLEKKCCAINQKDSSCCKDKAVFLEKKADTATIKNFLFQVPVFYLAVSNEYHFYTSEIQNIKKKEVAFYVDTHAPPLFKLYHQYIFYS